MLTNTPGKAAYDAYYQTTYGARLKDGVRLPEFKDQPDLIQEAWELAAQAVIDRDRRLREAARKDGCCGSCQR